MDGKGAEPIKQPKQAATLSTVSLNSSYDHNDDDSNPVKEQRLFTLRAWGPCLVTVGFVVFGIFLVLALKHNDSMNNQSAVDENDSTFVAAFASSSSSQYLTEPQKKLTEWFDEARNEDQLSVNGGSSNMSISGILYPRKVNDSSLPFDVIMTVFSGVVLPIRQNVAMSNGRGYQWTVISLEDGDSIATNGCLATKQILPFDGLESVLMTAKWTWSDERSEVNVVFNSEEYTISKVLDDLNNFKVDNASCWLIKSQDEDVKFSVCVPDRENLLPKSAFKELFSASRECPPFTSNSTTSMSLMMPFVPLPLQKWYASYSGS